MLGHRKVRTAMAAALMSGALLATAGAAHAQRPASLGAGAPSGRAASSSTTSAAISPTAPVRSRARRRRPTRRRIASVRPPRATPPRGSSACSRSRNRVGIKHVEMYGYPGNPFPGTNPATPLNVTGLTALRALGDRYGLHFSGRHGNLNEGNWNDQIAASKIIGQDHIGEAGFPDGPGSYNTLQALISTAQLLNRLGKRSVEAGSGRRTSTTTSRSSTPRCIDNGQLKSAWEIVMDRTDPRWVSAQIDIGWAVCGRLPAAPTPRSGRRHGRTRLINKFQNRIVSFHVKDMVDGIRPTAAMPTSVSSASARSTSRRCSPRPRTAAEVLLQRARPGRARRRRRTSTRSATAAESAKALKGDPAPSLKASRRRSPSVAARARRRPPIRSPVKVTNDGDAPLMITSGDDALRMADDAERRPPARLRGRQRQLPAARRWRPTRDVHDQRRLQADPHQLHVGRAPRVRLQQRRRRRAGPALRRADAAEGARVPRRRPMRPWTPASPPSRPSGRRTTSWSTRPPTRPTSPPPTSRSYRAVVFLNNPGDLLNAAQETALQGYIQGGGGFVGIGSAAEAEPGNTFVTGLIGARPDAASPTTASDQVVVFGDRVHPSTKGLPLEWTRNDIYYRWTTRPTGTVHTVARYRAVGAAAGDGTTTGGTDWPISWCRDYQGGRSFYTGMGRTAASYGQANFKKHLLGAIQWSAGLVRGGCKATIMSNYSTERLVNAASGDLTNSGESHGVVAGQQRLGDLHRPRRLPHQRRPRQDDRPGVHPDHQRLRQPQRRRRLRHDPRLRPEGRQRHRQLRRHAGRQCCPSTATVGAETRSTARSRRACSASPRRPTSARPATSTCSTSRRSTRTTRSTRAWPTATSAGSRRWPRRASRASPSTCRPRSSTSTPRS